MDWDCDIVVIGGGAAGLTAGQYGARASLRTLVLERYAYGGQALLISELENYPGFPDWITGFDFSERMEQQARKFGASLSIEEVGSIMPEGPLFLVSTKEQVYRTPAVILATGALHRYLGVPGEEELIGRGVSYCASCDGPMFKGGKILVVGGGDAACDEAHYLSNFSDRIVLTHRSEKFRAQESLLNRVRKNPHIEIRPNQIVLDVLGTGRVEKIRLKRLNTDEIYEEAFDAIFIFIGSTPITELAPPGVDKDEMGYIIVDENMESGVPGFYAIGDARKTPFRQLAVGVGDAALAVHAANHRIDGLRDQ